MASFSGQPLQINRFLGFCDIDDPSNLPAGIAALCRNREFGLTSVKTRSGINLQVNGVAAGIQGINKAPITGLIGLTYTPQNDGEQFFQIPLLFDKAGGLQVEADVGSGIPQALSSDLFTPPTGAHMIATQAYNKAWMAFSDLTYPIGNPSSPAARMAVFNLNQFRYGDASKALDPYGMKPYGWNWMPNTKVLAGEVCCPTRKNLNGHTYQCTQAGTVGSVEPTWPTTTGGTVSDGTAAWKENTPTAGAAYQCYPPQPSWTVSPGGGSWPTDQNGSPNWIYFVYTYVTSDGETDIVKAIVGLQTPSVSSESYSFSCPTPASAPAGFSGNVPTGWNLYIATAPAGSKGIPDQTAFQKWNSSALSFATPYTVSQRLNNGAPPPSNTANVVGAGNCDALETIDAINFTSGSGLSGALYEIGIRYMAVMFVNRNYSVSGFTKDSVVPVRLYSNGSTILVKNIPTGPENTIARIVVFTSLQFDPDPTQLPVYSVSGGGGTSGQLTAIAWVDNYATQWRYNASQWQYVNHALRTADSWDKPILLDPVYTQAMAAGLGSNAVVTGVQFFLGWGNQPGGGQATLVNASLNYHSALLGVQKALNIKSQNLIPGYPQGTYTTLGGDGDLWGASLTAAIINDTSFGLEFQIQQGANGNSARDFLDYVVMTVFFAGTSENISVPMAIGNPAGPYFSIGNFIPGPDQLTFPDSTLSGGYKESSTVINDNTTTTAYFSYTDPYLISSSDRTDRLRVIWPYAGVDIYYSPTTDRMFVTGVSGFNGHWVSLAADPESFYSDSGFIPTQNADGERALCVREFRGQVYSLRERSGHVMQIASVDDNGNPSWAVRRRWGKIGPCGPRAVDVCGRFMCFVHRSGIYKYDGNPNSEGGAPEPLKVSKEIKYWWETINWQAAETIWLTIDEETNTVRIGVPTGESTVPNQVLYLYYEEGWNTPIHFSAFLQKEVAMEACRRVSIHDVSAFLGTRIERSIPTPPPLDQGSDGIDILDSSFYTSQFLYASSAPDGCALAVTPGIYHDGEGSPNGVAGIDDRYETTSQGILLMECKFEGFSVNARGNGKMHCAVLQGRTTIEDWTPEGSPKASSEKFLLVDPIDLAPDQHVGDTRLTRSQWGERWRVHFSNGKVPDAWNELKFAILYAVPFSSSRPQSQQK